MKTVIEVTDATWQDLENRDRVLARFVYDDTSSVLVSVPRDRENTDFLKVLEFFSEEDIDSASEAVRAKEAADAELDKERESQRIEQDKANKLFNAKIQAFEIEAVRNAPPWQKSLIRKAKSGMEVQALCSAIIIESGILNDGQ